MSVTKRLVCLANSRKLNGRCIAGKELTAPQGWVRPVSAREHEEVSEYERQYQDGSDPKVLDVMDVTFIESRPKAYQQENWLLDPERYWIKVRRVTWDELLDLLDPVGSLWANGSSTYNGHNDQIPLAAAAAINTSLKLIRVTDLELSVFRPGEAFGNLKRRVQGRFSYGGHRYRLWVTDPGWERTYLAKQDGDYGVGDCCLTVSLGEPHNGACYKLVAAIIGQAGCAP